MVPEMIYLEKLHRNSTIIKYFVEMSLATVEWCECFTCAALVKQRDHKAGLAVQVSYEGPGCFVCKCG